MAENSHNKKLVSGILVIAGLLVFVFTTSTMFRASSVQMTGESCGADCPHEQQVVFLTDLIPLLVGFGIMAGAGVFYFTSQKVVAKEDLLKRNTEILLRFLSREERLVVNKVIEGEGKAFQAEISRIPGMGKVKSHRIIKRLMQRGVLEKDGFGKTHMVRFTKEVKEGIF